MASGDSAELVALLRAPARAAAAEGDALSAGLGLLAALELAGIVRDATQPA
ncbi:MAG: hypothetical protein ACR2KV_07970 [Solirubrobacteraceae bacterium]